MADKKPGKISIVHATSGRTMECSAGAFDRVYAAQGWLLAGGVIAAAEEPAVPATTSKRGKAAAAKD